ncbi:MAG: hypothetical protein AAFP81_17305 [Pseudomonadota bacterium]
MTDYVLIKRGLYWRPNASGYTGLKTEAGRYSEKESAERTRADTEDGVSRMSWDQAEIFSPSCPYDAKFQYYRDSCSQLQEALDTIDKGSPKRVEYPNTYKGGFEAGLDWAGSIARDALRTHKAGANV